MIDRDIKMERLGLARELAKPPAETELRESIHRILSDTCAGEIVPHAVEDAIRAFAVQPIVDLLAAEIRRARVEEPASGTIGLDGDTRRDWETDGPALEKQVEELRTRLYKYDNGEERMRLERVSNKKHKGKDVFDAASDEIEELKGHLRWALKHYSGICCIDQDIYSEDSSKHQLDCPYTAAQEATK